MFLSTTYIQRSSVQGESTGGGKNPKLQSVAETTAASGSRYFSMATRMNRRTARHILFLSALSCTTLLGCSGDRTKDDAQERQPDEAGKLLYSLPPIEVNCPSGQFRFKIDERAGQHSISGTVTLIGCQEEMASLTESNKSSLAQRFSGFAEEDPLRLAALCCSSNSIGTREALESMERYRTDLLNRLNADFTQPKIVSFICAVVHGEDI
jgi:hypothetical protein